MNGKDFIPGYDMWNLLAKDMSELTRTIRLLVEETATNLGHQVCSVKTINQKPLPDELLCFCTRCPFEVVVSISDELVFHGETSKEECPAKNLNQPR